jgi:hypothetical protein
MGDWRKGLKNLKESKNLSNKWGITPTRRGLYQAEHGQMRHDAPARTIRSDTDALKRW